MKAAVVTRFGPPAVLQIREIPQPEPAPGEVVVRVFYIGVNFAEVFGRLGLYPGIARPPFVPGIECSGVIESVGQGVKSVRKGDRVMAFAKQGTYAEFVRTNEAFVLKIPRGLSLKTAAAISVTYYSAYHGLITLANLQRGEKVLIHAGAGGVGSAALQIARHIGAEAFATVGSDEKRTVAMSQGADHVINYRNEDFKDRILNETEEYGVDVILDSVGGSVFKKGWRLLAPMGRYVIYGFAAVAGKGGLNPLKAAGQMLRMPRILPTSLPSKNVSLMGFNLYFLTHKVDYFRRMASTILDWHAHKIISPLLGRVFPFEEVVESHRFLQSRRSVGKVLLQVQEGK